MLTTQDKILIEQRITNEKPSSGVAYLLAIFLGPLGAHRFYLGRTGTGVIMLILSITFFGLIITLPWTLIDLFLIPGIIREKIEIMRRDFTLSAAAAAA
jgi:TM2 domain-containing membrane protein YozV